ncbi:MAG: hypothetical protein KC800_33710 [Candidatus Eremiobacteraeota bacterium]|nr:hypothetical protein [Candidatus Eremiobacteraeota bacterium]
MSTKPALSVILLAPYGIDKLDNVMLTMSRQTIAEHVQIIIATQPGESLIQTWPELHSVLAVPVENFTYAGPAKMAAIRVAESELIAFAEDHCFPEPGWAEALVEAHKGPYAAVSPWMGSANPHRVWSVASFFNFLPSHSEQRGRRNSLPTHNSCYKKRLLLEFGENLGELLEMETARLVPDLLCRGWTVLHEPNARVWHLNIEKFSTFVCEQFYGGRHYGWIRASNWSMKRKVVYAVGSVLIPALRLVRQGRSLVNFVPRRYWPAVLFGFLVNAGGEAWGYLAGLGRTCEARMDLECWRERFLIDHLSTENLLARFESVDSRVR